MKDTYFHAKLISFEKIRLICFSSFPFDPHRYEFRCEGKKILVSLERLNSVSGISIADFALPSPLKLGHEYTVLIPGFGTIPVDVDDASTFPEFDSLYSCPEEELGASYSPERTLFSLWAPLASACFLKARFKNEERWRIYPMKRGEKGVYRISLEGDQDGLIYLYCIRNSGLESEVTDLYAKASLPNGEASVVLDFARLSIPLHRECVKPRLQSQAVIYEGSVRDLTIDPHTDIANKGKFLGLIEKGRRTEAGNPAGFDYLLSLGFTHLQLLPLYDFKTVDERNPSRSYNWGYDPAQYFVPEGSYCSDVEDPSSRIKELKRMVAGFHEEGIGIVMDVVYNHVYGFEDSPFQKTVPNYYFRRRGNGSMANTSGCGDDFASERPMARSLILSCCKHWIEEYGVDGFRFDLMGILDAETLLQIQKMAKGINPSFLLYGEGWNMGGEVACPLGRMENYASLPEYGFFNDFFRETAKFYFSGRESLLQKAQYCFASSSVPFHERARFLSAGQSLNYVECHDNSTYFDFLSEVRPDFTEEEKLDACLAASAFVLLSFGVPFLHSGQEIGASKWGEGNTYNKGDSYNKFPYRLLDERKEMAEKVASFLSFRKEHPEFSLSDPKDIEKALDLREEGPCLVAQVKSEGGKTITVFFNPCQSDYNIGEEWGEYRLCSKLGLKKASRKGIVPGLSATVYIR